MAVTFYEVPVGARGLACDDCGGMVDGSERGRAAHLRWHAQRAELAENVVDLRERLSA